VKDQKTGWNIYWDHKADFQAIRESEEDAVPDDSYGFHPPAARSGRH
jgi:hypothetical protein